MEKVVIEGSGCIYEDGSVIIDDQLKVKRILIEKEKISILPKIKKKRASGKPTGGILYTGWIVTEFMFDDYLLWDLIAVDNIAKHGVNATVVWYDDVKYTGYKLAFPTSI